MTDKEWTDALHARLHQTRINIREHGSHWDDCLVLAWSDNRIQTERVVNGKVVEVTNHLDKLTQKDIDEIDAKLREFDKLLATKLGFDLRRL